MAIDMELFARRGQVLRLQVAAKERARDELQSALDRLEGHIEEAADIWQGVRGAEREAAEEYEPRVARARGLEARRSALDEEIAALRREGVALGAMGQRGERA